MTSSSSEAEWAREPKLDLAVLKSWDFAESRRTSGGHLPYRMDHLERDGIRLHWTDRVHTDSWAHSRSGRLIRRLESATVPFAQTALMAPQIRRCDATFAMFESEANCLAIVRNLGRRSARSPFLVMTSWLSQILSTAPRSLRAQYRLAYRSVDIVYYLASNQRPILEQALRLPPERLRYIPFGVDSETFVPSSLPDGDYLLAVGRDSARDWPTFFEAVRSIKMPVKVCCRLSQLTGITVPPNVQILGHVDRDRYRELLGRARVVAVLTRPVSYPSGQSVLLEAMAMGRTVVVTDTASMRDYVRDGVDCLTVPPRDPSATAKKIEQAAGDDALRSVIGAEARRIVEARYDSSSMWGSIARDLFDLIGACR